MAKAADSLKTPLKKLPRKVKSAAETEMDAASKADESGQVRRVHVSSLVPLSEAMGGDKSPKEILQLILKAAFSITRATSASLMLINPVTETLHVEVAEGFVGKRIFNTRLRVGQGVTGWVAETGVPLRVGNVRKDPRYIRVQTNLRSELAVPLKIGGRILGVISCDSTRLNHFTPEDEGLVLQLAAHSARVIQNTRLYEEMCRRAEELELLSEVSRGLASTLDLREVMARAVEQTAKVCRAEIVSVFLLNEAGTHLELAACHGGSDDYRTQPPVVLTGSLLGQVIASQKVNTIGDIHAENSGQLIAVDKGVVSLLAVPLISKDKAMGILCVYGAEGRNFDKHDERVLDNLGRSTALAIDNARVHRRMMTAEDSLRSAEKLSMLGELAAGLAHEIRNPLTSIKVLFDSLQKNNLIASPGQQDSEMISKQITRLETIVEGFLATARTQREAVEQKIVDLNMTVDESMLLLASAACEGTRLTVDVDESELKVLGDPTQLSQVVYNLVLNAIQAIEKRGRINITTRRLPVTESGAEEILLEVCDDGPGLAESVQLKLFQPFVTTKKTGVGLGLSIVKRIVDFHNGRIEVESPRKDIGRGARVCVTLPAVQES